MIKELWQYFNSEFVLVIQHDGYVLDGNSWSDDFYKYDYIGAPWLYSDGKNVGNGGFSLRSKILQVFLAFDDFISATDPEDQAIGRLYRDYLIQKNNIIVSAGHSNASYEVATQFFNNGITVATHLFNAMSSLQHRAPGMVGALMNHPSACCSLVADGYHVDFAAIKIAKKIK